MRKTQSIAIGGMLTALAAVIMLVSNLVPSGMYTFPAAAGIIVYIISVCSGRSYSWVSFVVLSVLSMILCADKQAPLCFILFLGYYPLIKELLETIRLKIVVYILKVLIFNTAAAAVYLLLKFVFLVPDEEYVIFGVNLPLVFLLLLNIIFLLYDFALTLFFKKYKKKIYEIVTKFNKKF